MSPYSSGRNDGPAHGWKSRLFIVAIVLLAVASGAVILYFEHAAHSASRSALLATTLCSRAHEAEVLEWKACEGNLAQRQDLTNLADQKLNAIDSTLRDMGPTTPDPDALDGLRKIATRYAGNVRVELAIIGRGATAEARAYDRAFTDPDADRLDAAIERYLQIASLRSKNARTVSIWATLLTLALTVLSSVWLMIRQHRTDLRIGVERAIVEVTATSERRLAAMLGRASSLLAITDENGVIREARGGVGNPLGHIAGLQGVPLDRFVAPESRPAFSQMLEDACHLQPASSVELDLDIDGVLVRVQCSVVDYRSEPLIANLLWTIKDVTPAYLSAKEASETHERLNGILANFDVAFWSNRADGSQILYVSPGCEKIYGRPASDFYKDPKTWIKAVHPADRGGAIAAFEGLIETGSMRAEYRVVRPDGEMRWVVDNGRAVRNESGEVIRLEGFVRDCTAEKAAAAALEESRHRYDRTVANIPGLVYQYRLETDGSHSFPFFVNGGPEWMGDVFAEIQKNPAVFTDWICEEDRTGLVEKIAHSASTLEAFRWEGRIAPHIGVGERWFQVASRPERLANGATVWDGILLDVTERKRIDQAEQERAAADEANLAKSQFLSRMSHELRTPLNSILGFSQLLEMKAESDDNREMIAHLVKGGRHLLNLVNEVLDISRIDGGTLEMSTEPIDIDAQIEEALSLMEPVALTTGISLSFAKPSSDEPTFVQADAQRLRQILLNLVSNAVKYNNPHGSVQVRQHGVEEGRIRIEVRDTGPGIPPDKRSRLFTPFDRLGAEQSVIEGTGLGLAMAKRLTEAMGGKLWMEDAPGGGSTFILDLIAAQAPALAVPKASARLAKGVTTGKMVLYIEDNFSNTRLMETLVGYAGVQLQTSAQGRIGLEQARAMQPNLILLDLDLPDMPGIEVLRLLKSDPDTRDIPVVIVSADASANREQRARDQGAAAYVTKPFDVNRMLDVLKENFRFGASAA